MGKWNNKETNKEEDVEMKDELNEVNELEEEDFSEEYFDGVEGLKDAIQEGDIFELIEKEIRNSDMDDSEKESRIARLLSAKSQKINIMFVGGTGVGKSSTVNALFNMEVAKVGVSADPETDSINEYQLQNLTIWDTPGFGDGKNDIKTKKAIMKKLAEVDEKGKPLIDLVLVILDASSRDFSAAYELIKNVIKPSFGNETRRRTLVALNQADVAMKGRYWDYEKNEPQEELLKYLKDEVDTVEKRILSETGYTIRPVFYSAGFKDGDNKQGDPYNLSKLMYYITLSVPKNKRLILAQNINPNKDAWLHDDKTKNYSQRFGKKLAESIGLESGIGVGTGFAVGCLFFGLPGGFIGAAVGAVTGGIKGFFSGLIAS